MKIYFLLAIFLLTACQGVQKSARNVGYSAYELVGVEKRDLLRKRIKEATEDQKEAGESFTTALERLQQTYGVQETELERVYSRLNSAYEDAKEEVAEVKASREKMKYSRRGSFRGVEKRNRGRCNRRISNPGAAPPWRKPKAV
jgi:hypothetical protein